MKFKITMKDPDGVSYAIEQAAQASAREVKGLDNDEIDSIAASRECSIREVCRKWISRGEYITIEIDTEEETATVVPRK